MPEKSRGELNPFLRKSIAIFVSVCFILSESVSYAAPSLQGSIPDKDEARLAISIPEELGRIEESLIGKSDKTVIYIQDAHDSLEAQENIAKLIHYFVEHYGVKTVLEEGYEGPVPTDEYFGFIKDPQIKEKVSYFLMDKLRIGGAEYAHINRPLPNPLPGGEGRVRGDFNLVGADNIKLHLENIEWYRKNAKHKEETEKDLTVLQTEIAKLAHQHFPKELKEWMKLKKRFDEKQLSLLDYLKRVMALQSAIHESPYQSLALLLSAENTQDKVILEQVKQIDPRILFQEIDSLENELAQTFLLKKGTGNTSLPVPFLGERNHKLFHYHKALDLLKRLNAIEVTPPEYEALKETLQGLNTQALAQFIVQQTKKSIVLSRKWEENIQKAMQFYETSQARDEAIEKALQAYSVERIADRKGDSLNATRYPLNAVILVFGGFHKERIKEILQRRGYSFLVVSPKITQIDPRHQGYYKRLMSVGHHPFEAPFNIAQAAKTQPVYSMPNGRAEVRAVYDSVSHLKNQGKDISLATIESHLSRPRSEVQSTNTEQGEATRLEIGTGLSRRDWLKLMAAGATATVLGGQLLAQQKTRRRVKANNPWPFPNIPPDKVPIEAQFLIQALKEEVQKFYDQYIAMSSDRKVELARGVSKETYKDKYNNLRITIASRAASVDQEMIKKGWIRAEEAKRLMDWGEDFEMGLSNHYRLLAQYFARLGYYFFVTEYKSDGLFLPYFELRRIQAVEHKKVLVEIGEDKEEVNVPLYRLGRSENLTPHQFHPNLPEIVPSMVALGFAQVILREDTFEQEVREAAESYRTFLTLHPRLAEDNYFLRKEDEPRPLWRAIKNLYGATYRDYGLNPGMSDRELREHFRKTEMAKGLADEAIHIFDGKRGLLPNENEDHGLLLEIRSTVGSAILESSHARSITAGVFRRSRLYELGAYFNIYHSKDMVYVRNRLAFWFWKDGHLQQKHQLRFDDIENAAAIKQFTDLPAKVQTEVIGEMGRLSNDDLVRLYEKLWQEIQTEDSPFLKGIDIDKVPAVSELQSLTPKKNWIILALQIGIGVILLGIVYGLWKIYKLIQSEREIKKEEEKLNKMAQPPSAQGVGPAPLEPGGEPGGQIIEPLQEKDNGHADRAEVQTDKFEQDQEKFKILEPYFEKRENFQALGAGTLLRLNITIQRWNRLRDRLQENWERITRELGLEGALEKFEVLEGIPNLAQNTTDKFDEFDGQDKTFFDGFAERIEPMTAEELSRELQKYDVIYNTKEGFVKNLREKIGVLVKVLNELDRASDVSPPRAEVRMQTPEDEAFVRAFQKLPPRERIFRDKPVLNTMQVSLALLAKDYSEEVKNLPPVILKLPFGSGPQPAGWALWALSSLSKTEVFHEVLSLVFAYKDQESGELLNPGFVAFLRNRLMSRKYEFRFDAKKEEIQFKPRKLPKAASLPREEARRIAERAIQSVKEERLKALADMVFEYQFVGTIKITPRSLGARTKARVAVPKEELQGVIDSYNRDPNYPFILIPITEGKKGQYQIKHRAEVRKVQESDIRSQTTTEEKEMEHEAGSAPLMKDQNGIIGDQQKARDQRKDHFTHQVGLPLSSSDPDKDDQSQDPRKDVKREKSHDVRPSFLDSFTAIPRNNTVMATPIEKTNQGLSPAAPGTKTPTTNEVKMILAPSRKKSEMTSTLSLDSIEGYSKRPEDPVKSKEGRRAEVRKVEKAMSSRLERHEATSRFQEKYAVVVDMNVFDALSSEQRSEFYKLMAHYQDGERVKFVFPVTGDRQIDTVWKELSDRRAQFGNVEIPINPAGFDFQGRKVIHVSKEGIQGFYAALVEEKLRGSKDFYSVRYKQGTKDPGLLTAALLLLDSGKNEFFHGRSFSDIPQGLGLEYQIQAILGAYLYVGRSA